MPTNQPHGPKDAALPVRTDHLRRPGDPSVCLGQHSGSSLTDSNATTVGSSVSFAYSVSAELDSIGIMILDEDASLMSFHPFFDFVNIDGGGFQGKRFVTRTLAVGQTTYIKF